MSAPDTNVEKQEKKHRGPLLGIKAVLIYAVVLLGGFMIWTASNGDTPEGAETQIDGRTGDAVGELGSTATTE